ncbi:late competence development ComFB family protein [Desulfurispora thermophila]|uniref:late competence development ComFB family protein n=1 Tax=Desulfurispora thermophila TaxID=265470 RepID=UPI00037EA64E|nr:late competence development ComFB family protein [Desulfurispora thermophila]
MSEIFIKNCTENAVNEILMTLVNEYQKKGYTLCQCERCLADIKALALNNLKPHYVVSEKGEILKDAALKEVANRADVITAITRAIQVVAANPRHGGR